MSHEQLKTRLNDLLFSIDELIKHDKAEQNDSENEHADWEDTQEDQDDEPEIIDNSAKIALYERAKELIQKAAEELYQA